MSTISISEIQRDPDGFVQRLAAGESLLVVEGEKIVAEIRPVPPAANEPRPFGLCAGQFSVPADFDRPLPDEILKEFEGANRI